MEIKKLQAKRKLGVEKSLIGKVSDCTTETIICAYLGENVGFSNSELSGDKQYPVLYPVSGYLSLLGKKKENGVEDVVTTATNNSFVPLCNTLQTQILREWEGRNRTKDLALFVLSFQKKKSAKTKKDYFCANICTAFSCDEHEIEETTAMIIEAMA